MSPAAAQGFSAERYELQLRPEVAAQVLFGQARIQLRAGKMPSDFIDLPSPALQLLSVQVGDRPALAQRTPEGWRIVLNERESQAWMLSLELQYRAGASDRVVSASARAWGMEGVRIDERLSIGVGRGPQQRHVIDGARRVRDPATVEIGAAGLIAPWSHWPSARRAIG